MKKGQVEQIFIWIFVLILAVSILFFGIQTIKKGEKLKDEVLLVDFFKSLEKKINDYYYLDKGSIGTEEFILPSGVKEVCFIDNGFSDNTKFEGAYMISLKEFSNVFVFPKEDFKENRFNAAHFIVEDNPQCFSASGGRLRIKLENKGKAGVQIS